MQVDRRGFGVDVSIVGLRELERGLKSFDPALTRAMNGAIRDALRPVQQAARDNVPDVALSGWDAEGSGEWSTRLGWDPAEVRKGIKIKKGGRSLGGRGSGVSAAWSLANMSAAGAVFELAGRRSSGTFQTNLTHQHGAASRLIWDAWERHGSGVESKIRAAVKNAEDALQRLVDTGGG